MRCFKILIVDDSISELANFINISSINAELKIAIAENGKDALLLLTESSHDVLLTDLNMDGMDGYDLIREVSAKYPTIATVLVTGDPMATQLQAAAAGADQFLRKPFQLKDLENAIIKALKSKGFIPR